MATCAICNQAATREQGIALSGSEVFHKECVRRHGTTRSVNNRLREKLAEVERQAVRDRDRTAQRVAELEQRVSEMTRSQKHLRDDAETAQRKALDLEVRKLELVAVKAELRQERANYRQLEHDFERMAAERDAARSEAALHQTLARQAPVTPAPDVRVQAQTDTRDDMEIRYSLIELDGDPK